MIDNSMKRSHNRRIHHGMSSLVGPQWDYTTTPRDKSIKARSVLYCSWSTGKGGDTRILLRLAKSRAHFCVICPTHKIKTERLELGRSTLTQTLEPDKSTFDLRVPF